MKPAMLFCVVPCCFWLKEDENTWNTRCTSSFTQMEGGGLQRYLQWKQNLSLTGNFSLGKWRDGMRWSLNSRRMCPFTLWVVYRTSNSTCPKQESFVYILLLLLPSRSNQIPLPFPLPWTVKQQIVLIFSLRPLKFIPSSPFSLCLP